ncbi:aminoglycoside phosphotransferase family protein [Frankia sp. CNm7]|nr:aminoglycoside phosphotransferase family protein [Frankia nepalensis]MBL7508378.1 aminoglycoside phosphotransferase family protein [Frankia nepalensis]MBL7517378.1 aminoglycoside phosphotransferase family protein [Frankia nepalensis]
MCRSLRRSTGTRSRSGGRSSVATGWRTTRLDFALALGPIHGDAHVANLMVAEGGPVLIDFERFGWGQPEWDLAMTATEYRTAGWWTDAQYRAFVDAYGFDVTDWSGFEVLRRVHEIRMTTWIMQNVHLPSEIAAEYERRMITLRTGVGGIGGRSRPCGSLE